VRTIGTSNRNIAVTTDRKEVQKTMQLDVDPEALRRRRAMIEEEMKRLRAERNQINGVLEFLERSSGQ
jgi:hypothetical protein